jgi:hypothetical protein
MANPMSVMLMAEKSPEAEAGMKAAEELDKVENENIVAAAPVVTIKARTLQSLGDATNKVLSLFGAPPVAVEAVEIKSAELPLPLIKALSMINAAMSDYIGEPVVDFDAMATDKGALIEIAKLIKVLGDKGFKKFLASAPKDENKGTEIAEEMGAPEEESSMSEDKMMMRM